MLATIRSRAFGPLACYQKNIKVRIYETIILPVVLYGCETWSLIVREEHKLRVLRRIFGPSRDGMTGGWRKLQKVELYDLNFSRSIIRIIKSGMMRWVEHVARMGEKRNMYMLLVGNQREKDH
jgi:hypothetical protein